MGLYLMLAVLGTLAVCCSGMNKAELVDAIAKEAAQREAIQLEDCELDGNKIPTPLCWPVGAVLPWASSHPCEICYCTSQQTVACVWIDCAWPNCHWWQWWTPPGACCPVCRPWQWAELDMTKSASGPEPPKDLQCSTGGGKPGPGGAKTNVECYPPGSSVPSTHPCKNCYCDGIKIKCEWFDCPHPNCPPKYQFVPQGGCCPRCRWLVAFPHDLELSDVVAGK